MKLIVAGATGFVGSEIVRQSLRIPQITSVLALSRKPVKFEDGTDISKLKSVVLKDYGEYPDNVRKEFAGADACIWTVAITPTRSLAVNFAEVKRVCQECPLVALRAMHEAGCGKPFRFIYMSGQGVERDSGKKPGWLTQYMLMRGAAEREILTLAAELDGEVEACVAKPGLIIDNRDYLRATLRSAASLFINVVGLNVISAAMLRQVLDGFEKEPLTHDDLVRIGQKALEA